MYLKSITLKGFKSFAAPTTLRFERGITCVVGPNGSGKSNVVDAIRWVLGEQKTRLLRSDKMENVIFNGTKNRKPASMAEVSMSFENTKNILPTEYSTVTVTRRLYRTGESEYLLNNVSCRLKDITDLFLDTGIGSDSYAIIELKMVDEILNDKKAIKKGTHVERVTVVALSHFFEDHKAHWYDGLLESDRFHGDVNIVPAPMDYGKLCDTTDFDWTYESKAFLWMQANRPPSRDVLFWEIGKRVYDLSYVQPIHWQFASPISDAISLW